MVEPAMEPDALEVLTVDHRTVENLFALYDSTPAQDVEARDKVVREIVRELSIHAAVEEQLLYPLMRDRLEDGERLVREALDEHQEVKESLAAIGKADPATGDRHAGVTALIGDVRHHVEEEEGELFPKLRAAAAPEELRDLAGRIESAKRMAPTR
ncbi:MAG TPA: hemerythrin domain-containing protein, partial [Actinomycetota bacterium]|nr:hemerythrin domain-containing protein [Actinomycetota bacterium]